MADEHIFISYERSDRARAQRLAEALEQAGLAAWWDHKLLPGDRFEAAIQEALHEAACVIVLWSATSVDSDWVKDEANEGLERDVLVPILIDDVEPPLGFRGVHTARMIDWDRDFDAEFPEVLASVRQFLRRERVTPPFSADRPQGSPGAGDAASLTHARRSAPSRSPLSHTRPVVLIGLGAAAALLLVGLFRAVPWDGFPGARQSQGRQAPHVRRVQMLPVALPEAAAGAGAGSLRFAWPGSECWDLLRGDQLVMSRCGAAVQNLEPGRYTLRAQTAPAFRPITVTIEAGETTSIRIGGVIDFKWPGFDCWQIFRGEQSVKQSCGSSRHALEAGTYLIAALNGRRFMPFEVTVQDRVTTEVAFGGLFKFSPPGIDCWAILRGEEEVAASCGAQQHGLEAGQYSIRPRGNQAFKAFDIRIADGQTVTAP